MTSNPVRFSCRSVTITLVVTMVAWCSGAFAFSGEDILRGNPWYHQELTEYAARARGFSEPAIQSLKWHADYIDSYAYNPLWWAGGGLARLKVSLATYDHLAKLHFDDLFSTMRVEANWRRILAGTILGLLWAKEQDDVSAAHNILGVSLHAIQDFYAHSNWVDAPDRRNRTWFEVPPEERERMSLWTGAYEKPVQRGVKPHGKIEPAATILNMSGVSEIMPLVCSPYSPLSNSSLCLQWKNVREGVAVPPQILGVRVPDNVVYLAPPGIALDNKWVANIAVQVREVTDVTGEQLFEIAYNLAKRTSVQWLEIVEAQMNALGAGEFWQRVKGTNFNFPEPERTKQYEHYNKLPYTFLSAGPYPTSGFRAADDEQFFLRVRLKTASSMGAGTDADIILEANGEKFLLDYLPRANPLIAVNDFEAGDDMVYVVGPFSRLPDQITLRNDAATGWDVVKSLGESFVRLVVSVVADARTFLLSLIGGNADFVASNMKLWTAEELARVGSTPFSVYLDGGGEGKYTVYGTIRKLREGTDATGEWAEYQVRLEKLYCNSESKWDRGSDSDEPFVLALLVPLPGQVQKYRAGPYNDVDSKESRGIDHTFQTVRVPKGAGMLSVALSLWESDDESASDRDKLLDKFADEADEATAIPRRRFLDTVGAAIASDWKLDEAEVYAFSRVGSLRSGKVFHRSINRWVKGDSSITLRLNPAGIRNWGISPSQLEQLPR